VSRLQRRIAAAELRNRAVVHRLRHDGPERLAALISVRGADVLQRLRDAGTPTVVLWWHQGAARAVETALSGLGVPLLVATNAPRAPDCGYRWRIVPEDAGQATQFMMQARKAAEAGEIPVLALDTASARDDRLPFLSGSLPIPMGSGWLAARTGARLVPTTSRWIGLSPRVEVTLHPPIPEPPRGAASPAAWEREVVASAVRWYEEFLRTHPETLGLPQIRRALEPVPASCRAPSDDDFMRLAEDFDGAD
jgi:lauroyl/myristoyl acyltransferase